MYSDSVMKPLRECSPQGPKTFIGSLLALMYDNPAAQCSRTISSDQKTVCKEWEWPIRRNYCREAKTQDADCREAETQDEQKWRIKMRGNGESRRCGEN
jgi:hypothetical protein